jgi:hypothetical protein
VLHVQGDHALLRSLLSLCGSGAIGETHTAEAIFEAVICTVFILGLDLLAANVLVSVSVQKPNM